MATFSAVFAPATTDATAKVSALAAATSSGEVVLNKDAKFVVIANTTPGVTATTPGIHVKFGQSGMAAATAASFFIPVNTYVSFDLSNAWDRMRFFNQDTVTVDIYVMQLSD